MSNPAPASEQDDAIIITGHIGIGFTFKRDVEIKFSREELLDMEPQERDDYIHDTFHDYALEQCLTVDYDTPDLGEVEASHAE